MPKCNFVIEGVGHRALYAIAGAVSVLEEKGFVANNIIGISSGSVVGALWAAGYNAGEVAKLAKDVPVYSRKYFATFLVNALRGKNIDKLKVGVSNLESGQLDIIKGTEVSVLQSASLLFGTDDGLTDGILTSAFDLNALGDPAIGIFFYDRVSPATSTLNGLVNIILNKRNRLDGILNYNLRRTILLSGDEIPITDEPADAFDALFREGVQSTREFFGERLGEDDTRI